MTPPQHQCKYEDAVIDISASSARMEQKIDTMAANQERIMHLLYGNGEPGLKGRVDRLEQDQIARDKDNEKANARREKFLWWAVTSGIAGLAAGIWNWWKG